MPYPLWPAVSPLSSVQRPQQSWNESIRSAGAFSDVTFIQRVLTYVGQPPASCDSGTTISRHYTALYRF